LPASPTPINLADYERAAGACVEPAAWGYQCAGANDELTVRANIEAWQRIELRYRTMVDVSVRSTATSVLGTPITSPVLIAPTALQRLCHPEGEVAMARAAELAGTIMVVSTTATIGLEEVAAATNAPKWFQVYIYQGRDYTRELVQRAVSAGYTALVLTVDAPVLGRRERDIHDAGLTARDITWLRELSGLPVVVKGIVRADDARRAVEHGAAAVIVSNHGGRQLDTAIATARALAGVVEAIGDAAEVYVDGGIRRGTDVLKAIALGARAVLVGRPPLWGLALGGAEGARHVLELLRDELDLAMALSGCPSVAEITPDLVVSPS
jgi:isopentenyl diphosphate isomerase/L-lactate dehydrogenase-like FMN-dependent dehydrogenase